MIFGIVPFGIAAILLSLFTILHPGVRLERRRLARDEARASRRRAGLDAPAVTGPMEVAGRVGSVDSDAAPTGAGQAGGEGLAPADETS